jgi:hypothetical protein
MTTEERRNELRYRMLIALDGAARSIDHRSALPGVDGFEARSAASWLIENGYAVWSDGGVAITPVGRALIDSIRVDDRRSPPDGT